MKAYGNVSISTQRHPFPDWIDQIQLAAGVAKSYTVPATASVIPTTPIPTGGFLIIVPEEQVIKLDMNVADGFKYIISIGALSNDTASAVKNK